MSSRTPAEIIAVGSEFLLGGRTESNSHRIASMLAECGIEVVAKTMVGDVREHIADTIRRASKRAKVVIVTGGLGSTVDDCTREAIADATGFALRRRPRVLAELKQWYARRGRALGPAVGRQADVPRGAIVLNNAVGSAPGLLLEWRGVRLVALPGVPREALTILNDEGLPRLRVLGGRPDVLTQRTLFTFGLTELVINERIQSIVQDVPDVELGLLASSLGVSIVLRRWTAERRAAEAGSQEERLDGIVRRIREALNDAVYGEDGDTMEGVVGERLRASGLTISLAESCTGGLIGHRLTESPGASIFFDRGVTCYSNEAKHAMLGVSKDRLRRHGAVSAQVAEAMAVGIRRRSGSDIGLSVTGIAGPGGGSARKPVGLVYIGISGPYGTRSQQCRFQGDRQTIKLRASQTVLNILRLYVMNAGRSGS